MEIHLFAFWQELYEKIDTTLVYVTVNMKLEPWYS